MELVLAHDGGVSGLSIVGGPVRATRDVCDLCVTKIGEVREQKLLRFMKQTVERYRDRSVVRVWQVENEPVEPMYSNRLYCFDHSSKRWIKLAPMPEAKEAKGVMVEGKLYVIGGNTGKPSNRIDMYNTETNTWTQLAH